MALCKVLGVMKNNSWQIDSRPPLGGHCGGLAHRWGLFCCLEVTVALLCLAGPALAQVLPPSKLHVDMGLQTTILDYARAPADNPLKGLNANETSGSGWDRYPFSLMYVGLPLNETMSGPTNFDWSKLESVIAIATNHHAQVIPRFFIDYPGWTNTAIPWYLLTNGLQTWSYSEYGNTRSLFPNYEDPNLHRALTNFIAAYGARYDGDPRIAFVQVGTVGMWGEWHYGNVQMLSHWASLASQRVVMDAYTNAFRMTKLQMRYAAGPNNDAGGVATARNDNYPFGYYDDSFCRTTFTTNPAAYRWYMLPQMAVAGVTNKWRTHPYGGEQGSGLFDCIFSNTPCNITDFEPSQDPNQSWSNCVYFSHATYMQVLGVNYPQHAADEFHTNALAAAQRLGYELWVQSLSTWTSASDLNCSVTITNTGVAPFYYNWQIELQALTNGTVAQTWTPAWALTSVIPGDGAVTYTHTLTNAPARPFTLLMRAVNPMSHGKVLRFANVNQHATVTNWLTLGVVR
jgi:hypothetical protein